MKLKDFFNSKLLLTRNLPLLLVAVAFLFFLYRMIAAKSITDASLILGVSCSIFIVLNFSMVEAESRLQRSFNHLIDRVLKLKFVHVFTAVFSWLLLTHALTTLGVHSWQGLDTGFFVQATYNAFSAKAWMFKNIDGDFSFFAHHFSPFLFLLAPLGKLPQAPLWLYVIQDVFVALVFSLIFQRIVKLKENAKIASALMLFVLLFHPFWFGLKYYEFHELSFAPFAMFLLLTGWEAKKPFLIFLSALLLFCIKETTFFSIAWFGALLIFIEKSKAMRRMGALVFALAVCFWFVYFKIILPQIAGRSESMFSYYYSHLGNSMAEVALSPIQRPTEFLEAVFTFSNAKYLLLMFGLCLPLVDRARNWIWILPVLPDFAIALLSKSEAIRNPAHQYAGLVIVPLMFVAISGYQQWESWSPLRKKLSVAWVVGFSFATMSLNPVRIWKSFAIGPSSALASREFIERIRSVPKSDSIVVAEDPLLPFAAQRDNLIWGSMADGESLPPENATWAVFKMKRLPLWQSVCGSEAFEWEGHLLCRLKQD